MTDHAEAKKAIKHFETSRSFDELAVAAYVRALEAERDRYRGVVARISEFCDPDDMVEDDEGYTEWGCSYSEAVEMSYDNVLNIARAALNHGGDDVE